MTGRIVFADHRGYGEIRPDDLRERIKFTSRELCGIMFADCLGAAVAYDVLNDGNLKRPHAVRVRPIRAQAKAG